MGCSIKSALAHSTRTIVSVNGVVIAHDAISREAQNHPAPSPMAAWTAAARALAVRELLLQEARRMAVDADILTDGEGRTETAEEAAIRALVELEVATPTPDEAACRRYYQHNLKRFRCANLYEAAHIMIPAQPGDREAYAAARREAKALSLLLRDAPQRFSELALVYSACPSKTVGGNLGQLSAGSTSPEFEAALAAMTPGDTKPVASRFGHHIVRLDRKIEGRELPFAQVKDRIADYLVDRARHTASAQYVARLAARAEIVGVSFPTTADLRMS
ncbi:MAG: peptidylprolyl isomerase [Rhodospirillales bacterium]|nr:peptidylprolyl isomerase [Rhodospirillales bacterium]